MSLATPDKIRTLQRKLYLKAKQEPAFRFYQLYDKVYRADILAHAYALCRANGGASGVDGVTFGDIESRGLEQWLSGLGKELHGKSYKPGPVRRVMIPKPGGGERPLGIPTIRDRVAQTAAVLVLEPIFEADFVDEACGYRPRRSALDAVKAVHQSLKAGYTDVVDADLSKREVMGRLGLTLNSAKTCVRDAREETFDFPGYTFGWRVVYTRGGRRGMDARPSGKSIARVKCKLREALSPWNVGPWEQVAGRVNRILVGWSNYFSHGTVYDACRGVDNHLYDRVRHFLRRRHKIQSGGTSLLPTGKSLRQWGVVRLLGVLFGRRHAHAVR